LSILAPAFKPRRQRLVSNINARIRRHCGEQCRHAMPLSFRPALPADFAYCERLYFANMERINRELKLDHAAQIASFRRQWSASETRIITLDGADIGWLQSATREGTFFLAQLFVDAAHQGRGLGTAVMHQLIGEATARNQAMTLGVVKINPAKRLYDRLGFRVTREDDRKFYMRREPGAEASSAD
jgi:ribosomal protein S18 acetylase RimI-like enzyme